MREKTVPVKEKPQTAIELPKSVLYQGQFSVRVSSEERREKILKLIERTGETSLGKLFWILADFYLEHTENGK